MSKLVGSFDPIIYNMVLCHWVLVTNTQSKKKNAIKQEIETVQNHLRFPPQIPLQIPQFLRFLLSRYIQSPPARF